MKKEDIEKLFDEKLSPVVAKLDQIEKQQDTDGEDGEEGQSQTNDAEGTDGQIDQKALEALFEKSLAPIHQRLEKVEKARGVSRQADNDPEPVQKGEDAGYMRHFS